MTEKAKRPRKAMTLVHAEPVPTQLSDDQRARFLEAIKADKTIGLVAALRQTGVPGTKAELRALVANDEILQEEARQARGWNLNRVEGVTWEVALNADHPAWDRANARILKAYHPAYRDRATVDVSATVDASVEIEDRSSSLADVALVLQAVGALAELGGGSAQPALPAAREVLAEPSEG